VHLADPKNPRASGSSFLIFLSLEAIKLRALPHVAFLKPSFSLIK